MKKLIDSESFVTRIREASKIRDLFLENNLKNAADDLTATIEHAKKNMFTIAVVGETKRGKSTLINGLLGRTTDALAPIGRFPTTNIITYYVNSSNESIHVLFQDNTSRSISAAEVRQYVCEDLNPQNQKKVKQLEIRGRFPLLGEDVCLADTPGANNALSNIHDLVLLEFLPNADAVVFLTTVGTPITASEQKLLQTITKDEAKKCFLS